MTFACCNIWQKYGQSFVIFTTDCFSMGKVIKRTHLNDMSYVYCQSCYIWRMNRDWWLPRRILGNIETGIMEGSKEKNQYWVPSYTKLPIDVAVTETWARWTGHAAWIRKLYNILTYSLHGAKSFPKLIVSQLVKKFSTFYGTQRFITAFTTARHLSLSWARAIQSIPPHPTS
jgi:hypothetical protein